MHADAIPAAHPTAGDSRASLSAAKWLLVAVAVSIVVAVAGRPPGVRAAEEGPPRARGPESGDAADRLDRVVEKLDRIVDRMHADRMHPAGPPHAAPGGPGPKPHGDHGRWASPREYGHPGPDGEPGGRGPGPGGPHVGPSGPGPGMRSESRPGRPGPWGDVPTEMREMMQQRMREAQRRMDEAGEKFRQLEERIKKLEAEIDRLKAV